MEEDDTHLCLACNQTIVGLMNYVVHRKSQCDRRRSAPQQQPQQQHDHDQTSYASNQPLFDQSLNVREGSSVSQHQNELLSGTPHSYGLRSQDSVMLSSLQQSGSYNRRHGSYSHSKSSTSVFTSAQSNGGHASGASLSVDVGSPLSSFIASAFSPDDDSSPVDPNSVLDGTESPRSRPDFFQSLELKSITGEEKSASGSQGRTLRSKKKGVQEDTLDLDLPITMILSNLDFSSDEEESGVVGFPSDGEVSDVSDSELEWSSSPPKTHTGGKWKPGEGPTQKYHPHGPVGGKWKPGQGPQQSRRKGGRGNFKYTKPFFCNLCKSTFPNRFNYNAHFEDKTHKEAVAAHRAGTESRKEQQQTKDDAALILALDPVTGEFTEAMTRSEGSAPQAGMNSTLSSPSKKRQYSGPFCQTCDLYFDSITVYDIHCETKKHKENVDKLNKDLQETMLSPLENTDIDKQVPGKDLSGMGQVDRGVENQQVETKSKDEQSSSGTHYCIVCKKTFKRKYEMARHLLTHFHRQRAMKHPKALEMLDRYNKYVIRLCPFQCNICQFYFNRASDLLDHLQTPEHQEQCSDLVGPLLCVTCKYKTYSPDAMLHHAQSKPHKQVVASNHHVCIIKECHSKITCKYCGVQMHSAVRMKRHIDFRHKNRKVQEPLEVRKDRKSAGAECPDCSKVFRNKSALLKHYQCHRKPFKCEVCKKSFAEAAQLKRHLATRRHIFRERVMKVKNLVAKNASNSKDECQSAEGTLASVKENLEHTDPAPGRVRRSGRPRKPKVFSSNDEDDVVSQALKSVLSPEDLPVSEVKEFTSADSHGQTDPADYESSISVILDVESGSDMASIKSERESEAQGVSLNSSVDHFVDALDIDDSMNTTSGNDSKDTEFTVKTKKPKGKNANLFSCEECDFAGNEMLDLKDHYMAEHPSSLYTCEPCDQFFLSIKAYKIHCAGGAHQACLSKLDSSSKLELKACPHCSMKFSDNESFQLHVEFVHLHVSTEEAVQRVCQGRDMVTQLYGEHLRQLSSVSHDSSVSCPECGKFFLKNNLIGHLRTHTGERPFKCRHCTRDFGSSISLRRHLLEHIGRTSFTCDTCGKVFKKRQQYTLHQQMHASEKKGLKFSCEICGVSFPLEKQLIHHKKRHGERKFKCTVPGCHWTFVLKAELEQHMLTHTREKKYLCDICGWGAYSTTNLRRHAKTHLPAKEIPCEYCPYKAGCKTHLKRHMRIHIGAKPFKCLYCSYACNTHENMRKHILKTRKHQGSKIYPCKFCGFESNEAKEFRSHLMQEHMDYVKSRPSESLVKFTGLYHPEEDYVKPPEGSEIHQVMKGRFIKVYDGTRVGGTGDPVGPPQKKKKVRQNNQSSQAEQKEIVGAASSGSKTESATSQMPVLAQDIVDTSGAPVSLVTQQQQPVTMTIHQADSNVYPRGLPWTVVAQESRAGDWCQGMDVVVPQSISYRAPDTVQVVGNTTGATYMGGPGNEVPTILTMVNVDSQTFQQIEASGYQVIATGASAMSQ